MYSSASIVTRLSSSSKGQIHRNVSKTIFTRSVREISAITLGKNNVRTLSRSSSSWVEPSTKVMQRSNSKQQCGKIVTVGSSTREDRATKVVVERKQPLSTTADFRPSASNEEVAAEGVAATSRENLTVCFDVDLGKVKTNHDDDLLKKLPKPLTTPSFSSDDEQNNDSLINLLKQGDTNEMIDTNKKPSPQKTEKNDDGIILSASSLSDHISTALRSRQWWSAYKLYQTALQHHIPLDRRTLRSIILKADKKDLKEMYEVFQTYMNTIKRESEDEKPTIDIDALNHLIHSLSFPRDSKNMNNFEFLNVMNGVQSTIKSLDEDPHQHDCLPKFIHALLMQKKKPQTSAKTALYHLNYIAWNKFPVNVDYYEKILKLSTYRKQADFQFYRVLAALVNQDAFPQPSLVVKILHNQYPFTDTHATKSILNSISRLQKEAIIKKNGLDYRVDFGTLEYATYAAARKGSTDLILLGWDLVEMFGYSPSEGMYENAIQSFVMSKRQDHNAFAVLADMENNGFTPSRALISTMNRSIRVTERRVDNALYILKAETKGTKMTTSSLNCVLSAYASNGLVDKAFETYDNFADYEITPNSDTFAYLMESLSVDATTLIPVNINHIMGKWENQTECIINQQKTDDYDEWKSSRLMAADVILLTMKDKGFLKTEQIIHEYIRLLCVFSETEKARDFITHILDSNDKKMEENSRISLETFVILSNSIGLSGQIESAFEVANLSQRAGYYNGLPKHIMTRLHQLKANAESDFSTVN